MAAVLHREETGTNVLLTVGYFGLTVYALYCRFGKSHPRTALIHKFCSVLAMGSAFRCFYFGIPPKVWNSDYVPKNGEHFSRTWAHQFAQMLVFSLGNACFYAVYTLIVYYWSSAYFSTVAKGQRRPVRLFIGCVALFWFMQLLVIVLFIWLPLESVLVVHSLSVAVLGLTISIAFIYLSWKLSAALRTPSATSDNVYPSEDGPHVLLTTHRLTLEWERKLKKIKVVAFVGAMCWVVKSVSEAYQASIILGSDGDFPRKFWWLFIFTVYLVDEILTSLAVLLVLRKGNEVKGRSTLQDSVGATTLSDVVAASNSNNFYYGSVSTSGSQRAGTGSISDADGDAQWVSGDYPPIARVPRG